MLTPCYATPQNRGRQARITGVPSPTCEHEPACTATGKDDPRATHNPSAVGSSPTCPTGVSAAQRLAIRLLPLEIIPEQGRVAHLWHIRNLNPPVAGSSGTCPVTSAQVKRIESGLIPSGTVL